MLAAKRIGHLWGNSAAGVTGKAAFLSGRTRGVPSWGGLDVATALVDCVLVKAHGWRRVVFLPACIEQGGPITCADEKWD